MESFKIGSVTYRSMESVARSNSSSVELQKYRRGMPSVFRSNGIRSIHEPPFVS